MSQRVGIRTRVLAGLHHAVPAEGLEAYRRAGASVYDLMDRVQQRRDQLKLERRNPWQADTSTQYQFLFAWNAYVLQTLGDQFIEAADGADPSTVGFLPRVTAEQAGAFYMQVEPWVSRANQAASDQSYTPDVALPAALPDWIDVDPCPRAHLSAMMAAVKAIRGRAEVAMGVFEDDDVPAEHARELGHIHQPLAAANTSADYALQLWEGSPPQQLREQIEANIKKAIEDYYLLGQMLAAPGLAEGYPLPEPGAPTLAQIRRLPVPREAGFDPWCLTDPLTRPQWQTDPQAVEAIANLWRFDPDPRATLEIQAEIDAALQRRDIKRAGDSYNCSCPWSPIYQVMRPVVIGGKSLQKLQQFTYDVSAEEMAEGGPFKRDLLVSNFNLDPPMA